MFSLRWFFSHGWFCGGIALLVLLSGGEASGQASSGPPMGPEIARNGTIFRVWAPNAESVEVIGDFNNWSPGRDVLRKTDTRNGIWEGTVRSARAGMAYQFLINKDLRKRDPYGLQVAGNERYSVLYDHSAYNWRGDQPLTDMQLREMVIYEMHIGAFNSPRGRGGEPGTFQDAIRRLPLLRDLGINVVCLLPVNEFSGRHSWGYNPSDPFAVEQAYGGPDGLKDFVRAAHGLGIAVHLDIVHNHYGPQNLDLIQFDGTGSRDSGGIYFYDGPGGIAFTPWGPRPRFDAPMVRRYIRDNAEMWLRDYNIDGFRWDSTVNIRAYDDGQAPIRAGAELLREINDFIRAEYPGRHSIAEDSLDIGNFAGSWEYDYHHQIMRVFKPRNDQERDMNVVARAVSRRPRTMWRVVYTDNHDEAGLLNKEQRFASDVDPHNPGSDYARRLSGLASLLVLTTPGIPLLFMGNEMLMPGPFHEDRPLDWGLWQRHAGHVRLHRDLIALRRNLGGAGEALMGLECDFQVVDNNRKAVVYLRWDAANPSDRMAVAINFSGQPVTVPVNFPARGRWALLVDTEWDIYGNTVPSQPNLPLVLRAGTREEIELPPYSGRVYGLADRPSRPTARPVARPQAVDAPGVRELGEAVEEPEQVVSHEDEEAEEDWLSTYTTIALAGTFNDWSPVANPLKLAGKGVWAGRFRFPAQEELRLRLFAEGTEMIGWGSRTGEPVTLPCEETLQWSGQEIVVQDVAAGTYQVRFNEETRVLTIAETEKPADAGKMDGFRVWTSREGTTIRARVEDIAQGAVALQTEEGRVVRVRINALSEADVEWLRGYVRSKRSQ